MISETIEIGGRQLTVQPLRLGQVRALLDALDEMQGQRGGASVDAAAKLLSVGLPHEGLSVNDVFDLDASLDELNAAVATVIRVAGRLKANETGEAAPQPVV